MTELREIHKPVTILEDEVCEADDVLWPCPTERAIRVTHLHEGVVL